MDRGARLEALQDRVGYTFKDLSLLEQALTHASFRNEHPDVVQDNQRLEFLGDAVLEVVISHAVFRCFPEASEGRLTEFRAKLVNTDALASLATALDLGSCVRLGRGEELSGGRARTSVLADTLEALFGAVYEDGGFEQAERCLLALFDDHIQSVGSQPSKDPRSRLQQWAHAQHGVLPAYEVEDTLGPDGEPLFTARITVMGSPVTATASAKTKKAAARDAALRALEMIARVT